MQKRAGLLTVFSLFFIFSVILLLIFRQQFFPLSLGLIDTVTDPLQRSLYSAFGGIFVKQSGDAAALKVQSQELAKKIVDQHELVKEAEALRDQYDLDVYPSKSLVPAKVIGMKSFIPGVSLPEEIIIDKGSNQKIRPGQTVMVTNNVVGSITGVSNNRSLVSLISNRKQSLTARTDKTDALGIIKGKGNGLLVLENVMLSDRLERGDIIVTKGDGDLTDGGYPPDLVIGRIMSVDKKASNLFQSAEVQSLLDFSRLVTVFVVTN